MSAGAGAVGMLAEGHTHALHSNPRRLEDITVRAEHEGGTAVPGSIYPRSVIFTKAMAGSIRRGNGPWSMMRNYGS